jgi:D-amino peptidase
MRVYISADIEGVTGVVTWGQAGGPNSSEFDWDFARRMMHHDVNAAIRGCRAAGATEILIKDSHNTSKNLLIDLLEPGVELISGTGSGELGMMTGVETGFDCFLLVGYHAMGGTAKGVMEHTITGAVHRFWINDMPAGEIAMSAACAGVVGVPFACIVSDQAGCDEAKALAPGITSAVTKTGLGRYMGRLKHPSVTGPLIEEAARSGVAKAKQGFLAPWIPAEPVTVKLEQNRSEEADAIAMMPNWLRVDAYTLELTCSTWREAHEWTRRAMQLGSSARSNNS